MPETKGIVIRKLTCMRCNHEWIPNSERLPQVCPKCHSPYWNTPRKVPKNTLSAKIKRNVTTPRKVPTSMFGISPDLPSFSREEDDSRL